jgi:uncharacterized protein (DUF302 family)
VRVPASIDLNQGNQKKAVYSRRSLMLGAKRARLTLEEPKMSSYHFSKIVHMSFDDAVNSAKQALRKHNFRVLTEINMEDNFKKANLSFRPYLILGACNPQLTYRALQAEDKAGTMLPCNIVVQQKDNGNVEVSAVDPVMSMRPIDHLQVGEVAREISSHLQKVIDEVGETQVLSANLVTAAA